MGTSVSPWFAGLRADGGVALTLLKYIPPLLSALGGGGHSTALATSFAT
jgi:hypothetical protein